MENIRTRRILAYAREKGSCSTRELIERFGVSPATIHRDITALEEAGAVERVRGGVVPLKGAGTRGSASTYSERVVVNRGAKMAIAAKALTMIAEDDIIFLDSSTTVHELALLLTKGGFQHLTVVSNAIPVIRLFPDMPTGWSLVALGGNFDPQLNSVLGAATLGELSKLGFTKSFVSAFGLDARAATTNHERQAELLAKVIEVSDKTILAIDSSKNDRRGLYRIAARGDFAEIVTG